MGVTATGLAIITAGGMLTGKGPAGSLKPKTPAAPAVAPMPDQSLEQQAGALQEAQESAGRYGRAATILTGTGAGSPTSDKLGP